MKKHPTISTGLLLGYPSCCITAFENKVQVRSGKFVGTGFTQCEGCHRNVSILDTIDIIHRNRKIPFIFPFSSSIKKNRLTVLNLTDEFKKAFYDYHGKTVDEVAVNASCDHNLNEQFNFDSRVIEAVQIFRDSTTLPLEKIIVRSKVLVCRYNKEPAIHTRYSLAGYIRHKLLLKSKYSPGPVPIKKEPDA